MDPFGRKNLSFAEKPVLTGDRVTLRPVETADASGLLAFDPETNRLTGSHGQDALTLADARHLRQTRSRRLITYSNPRIWPVQLGVSALSLR